jgi:23S rRNA (cytidine2498-2'-O)-methyltransferase
MLSTVLAQCREGFEPEAAEDVQAIARAAGVVVDVTATPRSGYVVGTAQKGRVPDLVQWSRAQRKAAPVFIRSAFYGMPVTMMDAGTGERADRVTPLAAAASRTGATAAASVFMEHPDTNAGKALSPLARALEPRLRARLCIACEPPDAAPAGRTPEDAAHARLHVFLVDGRTAIVGLSEAGTGARWPMGIPRLRVPAGAPSRAVRKLAEAYVTFLGDDIAGELRPGMHAVDLGAAPGGWSWLLARHGLRVAAVDNGPLKGEAADDALITHVRQDGLRYRPRRRVDWVTCDIVESPARIATLMAEWIAGGHARRAIFNLKLPMKRRHAEVQRCRDIVVDALRGANVHAVLRMRQLYHDREEVTAYLAPDDAGTRHRSRRA